MRLFRWLLPLLLLASPALAQWQVSNHAVPVGRGAGITGFKSVAPGTSGCPVASNGPSADPAFTCALATIWSGLHTFTAKQQTTFTGPDWATLSSIDNSNTTNINSFPLSGMAGNNTAGLLQAVVGAIEVPSIANWPSHAAAVAGYVRTSSTNVGAVPVYGQGTAGADGTSIFGGNLLVTNSNQQIGAANSGHTSVSLYGLEFDMNVAEDSLGNSPTGSARGLYIIGGSRKQMAGSGIFAAVEVEPAGVFASPVIPWKHAFKTTAGAATIGMQLGPVTQGTANVNSQTVVWQSVNGAGVTLNGQVGLDNSGNVVVVPGTGGAVVLTDASFNSILSASATQIGASKPLFLTNAAAPSSPSAGFVTAWADSTDLRLHDKNSAGAIGTTVVADTGASNNFLTAISAAGVVSKAQPAFSNLSGSATCAQMPALTGGVTTSAGSCATTVATNANLTGDVTSAGNVTTYSGTLPIGKLPNPTAFIGRQTFCASGCTSTGGAYTATTGTNYVNVRICAPGGGGGGCAATGVTTSCAAGGGGAGGYAEKRITSSFSGVTITVPAGGAGGTAGNNPGTSGSSASFGALISAAGGSGGSGGAANVAPSTGGGGGAGATGASGDVNGAGGPGVDGFILLAAFAVGGNGGSLAPYGSGGKGAFNSAGTAAVGFCSGGSGAGLGSSASAVAGGAGSQGLVIVDEYR